MPPASRSTTIAHAQVKAKIVANPSEVVDVKIEADAQAVSMFVWQLNMLAQAIYDKRPAEFVYDWETPPTRRSQWHGKMVRWGKGGLALGSLLCYPLALAGLALYMTSEPRAAASPGPTQVAKWSSLLEPNDEGNDASAAQAHPLISMNLQ